MNELVTIEKKTRTIVPACSISEENGSITLKLEMPGVAKENLTISIEKNELSITGTPSASAEEGEYLIRERRKGKYRKVFTIDDSIDRDRIDAASSNGIATLTLRVKEAEKPRLIEIK